MTLLAVLTILIKQTLSLIEDPEPHRLNVKMCLIRLHHTHPRTGVQTLEWLRCLSRLGTGAMSFPTNDVGVFTNG